MNHPFVGLDFGTTNSAVALLAGDGEPTLLRFPAASGPTPTQRTVLHFEPSARPGRVDVRAGALAIDRYVVGQGHGRLVQSIKSHLASGLFDRTRIYGQAMSLTDLVAAFVERVRFGAERDLGTRVVVGRPVRYWGERDASDERRALDRMETALRQAGFDQIVFEYEPVAAALRYARGLERDELVLIADLGGGTSDFCLLRVGPGVDLEDDDAILATRGVGIGGDAFDGRLIDHVVAPRLGRGGHYTTEFGNRLPVPPWIFGKLRRWHHLSFLRDDDTRRLLERLRAQADDTEAIERLCRVIEDDLGFSLYQAVERVKLALSERPRAAFELRHPAVELHAEVRREDFEAWIAPDVEAIGEVVDEALAAARVAPEEVDRVFTTGGSSFVPAVREELARRFDEARFVGGGELTAVAVGLALRARQRFGGRA